MVIAKNEAKMARKGGAPENLRPCTPENARERQLKSAQKRSENASVKKIIEDNLQAVIDLVNTPMTEEEFKDVVGEAFAAVRFPSMPCHLWRVVKVEG